MNATTAEIVAVLAVIGLQTLTIWAWWEARFAARWYRDLWEREHLQFIRYRKNSIRRDPVTGRYVKERP